MSLVAQSCTASGGIVPPLASPQPQPSGGIMGAVPNPASSDATTPVSTSLLGGYPRLQQWVAAFTLKVPSRAARRAVATALFQICEEEVSTAPSLRTHRKAPEVLPLLLRVMLPRLQQAAEVFAAPADPARDELETTRYDSQAACGQGLGVSTSTSLSGGGGGPVVGAAPAAASISSSHEFLALLGALFQLALQPGRCVCAFFCV
jgi:hypothetical protein